MKTYLDRFVALGLLFLLCLQLGGAIQCYVCEKVKMDNSCFYKTYTCRVGFAESCYTRRFILGNVVIRIERGCTSSCHSTINNVHFLKGEILCCQKSFCNTHDIWLEH